MAKCEVVVSTDFERALHGLETNIADIEDSMLEAGGAVLADATRSELQGSIGSGLKKESRSTGELAASIGCTRRTYRDKDGNPYRKVGFNEPRRKGNKNVRNGRLAAIIAYGQHGQQAHPFLNRAARKAKSDVEAAMESRFNEEVAKYDGSN